MSIIRTKNARSNVIWTAMVLIISFISYSAFAEGQVKGLHDCYRELSEYLSKEQLEEFKATEETNLFIYHESMGKWVRNTFGLWQDTDIRSYFVYMGITNGDDMSEIILSSFHRYLRGRELKLREQIKLYKRSGRAER